MCKFTTLFITLFCIATASAQKDSGTDGVPLEFEANLYELPPKIAASLATRIESGDNEQRLKAMTLIPDLAAKKRITQIYSAKASTMSGNTEDTFSPKGRAVFLDGDNSFPHGLSLRVSNSWIGKDGRVYSRLEILQAEAAGKANGDKRIGRVRNLITREVRLGIYLENDLEDFVAFLETEAGVLLFTCRASYDDDKIGVREALSKSRNVLNMGQAFAFRTTDDTKDFIASANATKGKRIDEMAKNKFANQTHRWIVMAASGSRYVLEDFQRKFRDSDEIVPAGLSIDANLQLTGDRTKGQLRLNAAINKADRTQPGGYRSSQFEGDAEPNEGDGAVIKLGDVDYLEPKDPTASANSMVLRYRQTTDETAEASATAN